MSQLDDLLARSSKPGKFVERRRFKLSRDKAIEKQREFALRHPSQYVTEFVQAAVFAGATYIAIDAKPHSLLVAWVGGKPLDQDEVENLLDYLFADRGDPTVRHLVQLAVGVNAALQRKPTVLRIESGNGERSIRMDVDKHGRADGGIVEDAIAGTYLYAEYSAGWFSRFTSSASFTREQALVEEKCLYTPVPILLNGRAPFGYRASRHIEVFGAQHQSFFDAGERRGVIAHHASERAERGFRIVVGGVWVTSLPLEELASEPLLGVLCDDRLRKTADHSDIVQDRRYMELLHAAQPHATELMSAMRKGYVPPVLPPLPEEERPTSTTTTPTATREAEPLPDPIVLMEPRGTSSLWQLQTGDAPLFFVTPENLPSLRVRDAEPDRFPWRVLVLTEGQALTLSRELGASPHKLTAPADLDFVRRMLDRQDRVRTLTLEGTPSVTLTLHLEGHLPDWGHGRPGVPWCAADADGTHAYGVWDDGRIHTVARRTELGVLPDDGPAPAPPVLPFDTHLPGISVRVQGSGSAMTPSLARRIVHAAWRLAVPEQGEVHRPLLTALLGALAVPQLVRAEGTIHVAASLPVGWPDTLRHVPLVETAHHGGLSLDDFVALLGTDATRQLPSREAVEQFSDLERHFGVGHLTHPDLEGRPLFGVAKLGRRWVWLESESMWSLSAIEALCLVGCTLHPRTHDDRWVEVDRPSRELVAARRRDLVDDIDFDAGWEVMYSRLEAIGRDHSWAAEAAGSPDPARAEGMGRLALLHLADRLGHTDHPILAPSDNGARRDLHTARHHAAARVAARHGVEVAEPWTFLLTRDELALVMREGRPELRYDDSPAVWSSLATGDDGWLIRHEVRQPTLQGWLGLRKPYDATAGVLIRTTDRLVALHDLDHRVPCHGLLWPTEGRGELGEQQLRTVRLAALRLYQELLALWEARPEPEAVDAIRGYAFAYAWLARHAPGARIALRVDGSAMALRHAVVAGIGVHFLPCHEADARSDLVDLGHRLTDEARDLWVLTLPSLRGNRRVRAFMDHAYQAFAELAP